MGVDMAVQTTREFFEHFCIVRLVMAIGALRNLAMFCMAVCAGNAGMFTRRSCPDFINLIMAGAARCLGSCLIGNLERPVHGMA